MQKEHHYQLSLRWTGNSGTGTSGYRAYHREHIIEFPGKEPLVCSSDPAFRGDAAKYNPEELLLASLSGCHMLWYLHLCADSGIVVTNYSDAASGTMEETANGGGRFTGVTLKPQVTITNSTLKDKAAELHQKAHTFCFIANSVNFPVRHEPVIFAEEKGL